jgi:DNA-binding NarL/FixJ family response regulator
VDDGLRAATALGDWLPDTGCSSSRSSTKSRALDLSGDRAQGVGYLRKSTLPTCPRSSTLCNASPPAEVRSTPGVVGRMLGRREREVLAAMAEGKSTRGIAEALVVSETAVENT